VAEIRDLRIEAVGDPAASIAFLSTVEQERAHDEVFWRERAAGASLSDEAASSSPTTTGGGSAR
jgi:hypothetical protein